MKKILKVLGLGLMVLPLLTGCTKKDAAKAGGKTKLEMWCIATESDSNRHSYEEAIKVVTAAHPEAGIQAERRAAGR